jgi:hypothetical protein
LKVAPLVVDQGWPISEVAARFQVSWPTVKRWADRYAHVQPMTDRSSRPRHQPGRTAATVVKRVLDLRRRKRLGPLQLAARTGIAASTVHKILVRDRLNRLDSVERATGEPVRRYEHPYPGSLIHVDVNKLGDIPEGGGWRFVGRVQGQRNKAGTPGKRRNKWHNDLMRHAFVHVSSVINSWAIRHGRNRCHIANPRSARTNSDSPSVRHLQHVPLGSSSH